MKPIMNVGELIESFRANKVSHPAPNTGQSNAPERALEDQDNARRAVPYNHFADQNARKAPEIFELTERQLLAQIVDLLQQSRQVDVPADFMHPRSYRVAANTTGTIPIEGMTQYGYMYVPPQSVDVTFYYGHSTGQLLGTIPAGSTANFRIPHIDVITMVATAGSTDVSLTVYPSTRPFELELYGASSGGGGGVVEVASIDGAPNIATGAASVTPAATLIVAARPGRRGVHIGNFSSTGEIYIGPTAGVTSGTGMRLTAIVAASAIPAPMYFETESAIYGISIAPGPHDVRYLEVY